MDYRKKGEKPHHPTGTRALALVLGTYLLVSIFIASIPISAYSAGTTTEEIKEEVIKKELNNRDYLSKTISIELSDNEMSINEDDPEDIDPLSLVDADQNPDDIPEEPSADIIKRYVEYLEYSMPFTTHFDRDYSTLTGQDLLILKKIVVSEIGNCTFEQQAATAAMCLNRLYDDDFPDTMFENAIAPWQFRESYGYAPWPEATDKTELAISLALEGIDFSCNAVGFYTPEYSSEDGCKYFEEEMTTTAVIPSKCEGETSVFACCNAKANDALKATKYIYSKYFDGAIVYYG